MDYTSESGTVSIPTLFMWRHGGSIVHISGSFTGWAQCPMTPIEGCPTVFQTICSVLPGRHQYKFVVDGTWRHDEDQPSVISTMGIVNTIHLPRDADHLSPMPSLQAPPSGHGSSMDVDNETFQCVVRLSGVTYPKPFVTISEADLEISRHRIAVFMSAHKAYELLPESGKVIALDVELPVKQAFHVLHEQGISMAPLWDISRGNFVGVLSAMDFILIMRELRRHGSKLTEEELETHTISAWKEAKPYLNNQINGQGAVVSRQLVQAGPDDSLNDVALKILQNGVATVPIIHSSSADSLNKNLLHLASLSGILKCICRFFRHSLSSLPVLQLPICSIPLGTWVPIIGESNRRPLAMLRSSASLSAALNLFIQAQVSSIPIVDDNDSLLDVYSRSDITSLARNKIYTRINLDETTIFEALQYRDDPFLANGSNIQRCFMCLRSDPLHKVLERLAQPGVRRLVVVEAGSKHVEGIVSLNDVFRFIMGC